MRPVFTFTIRPQLPARLAFLGELAYNLWWSWNLDAIDLFMRIDRELWDGVSQNPVLLLGRTAQARLDALADDDSFLAHMERVEAEFRAYLSEPRWFQRQYPEAGDMQVAYFSAEYGLVRCLPVYSGGLGVLSGDHMKTASDMGLPLVGLGIAYRQGYFRQYLNIDGWQQERYLENDFYSIPMEPVRRADESRLIVHVPYAVLGGGGGVDCYVWRVNVGRVPIYLLSTNVPSNPEQDRGLTAQLYGGDRETRIRQEIVLGIGGVRVLRELGISATAFHMNEGHSAFLGLERIRALMTDEGLDFAAAYELVYASTVFTTHTPVPAGNDVFDGELARRYLEPVAADLGTDWEALQRLGTVGEPNGNGFSMPVLALKTAAFSNGVSRLHAQVAQQMWRELWPELPVAEVPIRPVTNGVHIYSWLSREMCALFDRYIGPQWRSDPLGEELWRAVLEIPDEELWLTRAARRNRLVSFARLRLAKHLSDRGSSRAEIDEASEVLSSEALTIGFGRRFATYKRATLLFRDLDRLARLVGEARRPVQFIFAGKAHPRDDEGKNFIRDIVHAIRDPRLRPHFVFLEDYDLEVARYMTQGCDVWLNNPRRPLEASGTSGMKSVANGGLHLSTLDGWWAQGYSPELGWAIGAGEEYDDTAYQDEVEAAALYDTLEREVFPLFWERGGDLPHGWVAKIKASMANLIPRFCSNRMLSTYVSDGYLPSHERSGRLGADGFAAARELAAWRSRVEAAWDGVEVEKVEVRPAALASGAQLYAGETVDVRATLNLAGLDPADVLVEAYSGIIDNMGNFTDAIGVPMEFDAASEPEQARYVGALGSPQSGHFGFTVRVFPRHDLLPSKYALFRVTWNE